GPSIAGSSRLATSAGWIGLRNSRANDPSISRSTKLSNRCSASTTLLPVCHQPSHPQTPQTTAHQPHSDYTVAFPARSNLVETVSVQKKGRERFVGAGPRACPVGAPDVGGTP